MIVTGAEPLESKMAPPSASATFCSNVHDVSVTACVSRKIAPPSLASLSKKTAFVASSVEFRSAMAPPCWALFPSNVFGAPVRMMLA